MPGVDTYHPTFLYELLWNLALAGLLVLAGRRFTLRHGRLFALYVAGYTLADSGSRACGWTPRTRSSACG